MPHGHRKYLATRRRKGGSGRCNCPNEAPDSQDKRRGGNEAGYGDHGQGTLGGSVVNAATGHMEIGKSVVTAP